MIKAVIVEDDPGHSAYLKELLGKVSFEVNVTGEYTTVDEAFAGLTERKPDLVFLDIDLGVGGWGFDLLKRFAKPEFAVIFTTQFNNAENTIAALRACALDFLPKTILQSELEDALARYNESHKEGVAQVQTLKNNLVAEDGKLKAIWIRSTDGKTRIEIDNILYCESEDVVTHFFLREAVQKKSRYTSSDSIKKWEHSLLDSDICRVHNEYLVNLKYFEKYVPKNNGAIIKLKNGIELPVSRSRKENLKNRLNL